jgi:hypothetical protein
VSAGAFECTVRSGQPPITSHTLTLRAPTSSFIGARIMIYSRQYKVEDYEDPLTREALGKTQQT